MQRTKYFNQTRPSQTQLGWTDDSKVSATRRRLLSLAQMGIKSGFSVTPGNLGKINIDRGEGYTGGQYLINTFENGTIAGERVGTLTDTPTGEADYGTLATDQGLEDYTIGAKNYVSVKYSEDESYSLSERSYPFTAHKTVVTDDYVVMVEDAATWAGLSAAELSNRILIAIVTSPGPGNPIAPSDIEQFTQPKTLPVASQPVTIVGVTIDTVSETSPLGTSVLHWLQGTKQLSWEAQGESPGVAVTVSASGAYTLASSNIDHFITVAVVYGTLFAVGD